MSSTSPRTPQTEGYGLPIDKFLDLLDWATPSPCPQGSCIACKSEQASEQLPISVERLQGHARFCVGGCHQLAFSSSGDSISRVPVVLSVEDGAVRLCFESAPVKRCVVMDLEKLVDGPVLKHTEDKFCLEFVFPFLSLQLERNKRDNGSNHEAARSRELQFAAMKEAIVEVCQMPASNDQDNDHEGDKKDEDVSLFAMSLQRICENEETEKMSLDGAFIDLMDRGAGMVMPLCFPYNRGTISSSAFGNTRADHVAFVDAYLKQEAVWRRTIKQADAALYFAKRRKNKQNDGERTGETDEIERVEALSGVFRPP